MYRVFLTKTAQKCFFKLPLPLQKKCRELLKQLPKNPQLGKNLTGRLVAYRSVRLTSYRVVYRIEKKELIILVVAIRHRKDVYKRVS